MSEFIRVKRDEWEGFRKDLEQFIQRYQTSVEKIKTLSRENVALKEKLQEATGKLTATEQKVATELQQTSLVLQKMRANISRILEQTEKEGEKG